jgi:hypothetical protein
MDDVALGSAVRAIRIRKLMPQAAVARSARVHQWDVSRLEGGRLADLRVSTVRAIASTLGMRLQIEPRWHGPELGRLVNVAHAALQGAVLRRFERLDGWTAVPEASFSIYGERGAIDVLAWHTATRTLLVVELKTVLVEAAELVRTMDARLRLASDIGRERGWRPLQTGSWIVLTDTSTNRRHVAAHREILAPLAAADGRRMRRWLRAPRGGSRRCRSGTSPARSTCGRSGNDAASARRSSHVRDARSARPRRSDDR